LKAQVFLLSFEGSKRYIYRDWVACSACYQANHFPWLVEEVTNL